VFRAIGINLLYPLLPMTAAMPFVLLYVVESTSKPRNLRDLLSFHLLKFTRVGGVLNWFIGLLFGLFRSIAFAFDVDGPQSCRHRIHHGFYFSSHGYGGIEVAWYKMPKPPWPWLLKWPRIIFVAVFCWLLVTPCNITANAQQNGAAVASRQYNSIQGDRGNDKGFPPAIGRNYDHLIAVMLNCRTSKLGFHADRDVFRGNNPRIYDLDEKNRPLAHFKPSCPHAVNVEARLCGPKAPTQKPHLQETNDHQQSTKSPISPVSPILHYKHGGEFADSYGFLCIFGSYGITGLLVFFGCSYIDRRQRSRGYWFIGGGLAIGLIGCISGIIGCLPWDWWRCLHDGQEHSKEECCHSPIIVTHKYLLTSPNYCNTVIAIGRAQMANVLSMEKKIAVISGLAEGSGIRQIERITGVHRDTIMRLGVRVGQGCAALLDSKMRNLSCKQLQFDELWGFIGKKERHVRPDDNPQLGDVWTFCAIDSDTKLVPSFKVGKRNLPTANAFVSDVASRMRNRVQISSDALRAYVDAIEMAFGANVDFAQIIKTYVTDDSHIPERRFSAPEIVITEKKSITGFPDMALASTSHVERLNGTTRLHMRRLTRLTYAFSKKLENFEAAVALHFAYYNFVKRHNTLRATPAMAAGIERDFWTVGDLIGAAV